MELKNRRLTIYAIRSRIAHNMDWITEPAGGRARAGLLLANRHVSVSDAPV